MAPLQKVQNLKLKILAQSYTQYRTLKSKWECQTKESHSMTIMKNNKLYQMRKQQYADNIIQELV